MKCLICGGKNLIFLFSAKDYISGDLFSVCQCSECGSVLTQPIPRPEKVKNYYQELYYGRRKSFVESIVNYLRLKKILKLPGTIKKAAILDVGCGNGNFLELLAGRGFLANGTEVAPEYHFSNKKISSLICRKELAECRFPDNKFDVITMWHTLEHFSSPLDYLLESKRILKSGGFLIIEVPNFQSWQSRLTRSNWFHLDVPRHVLHCSSQTLNLILGKTGFKILKISAGSFIYGFFGLVQSLLNLFCRRKNLLFDILNGKMSLKESKKNRGYLRDVSVTIFLLVPISLLALPVSLLEIIFKKGAVLTVWAQKRMAGD